MRLWAEQTLSPNPADPSAVDQLVASGRSLGPAAKAKIALTLERFQSLKQKREIEAGKFHRTDECLGRRVRQINVVKTELLNLADGLPFDEDVKMVVRGRVIELCRKFAGVATSTAGP